MKNELTIKEDMHVHSTFSDGIHSLEENLGYAEEIGLEKLCCVDHVRRDTDWLRGYVKNVNRLKNTTKVDVFSGIETKLLNGNGDLDMPQDLCGIDYIYVADHQFPIGEACHHPREIRKMIKLGKITAESAIEELCVATMNAMKRYQNVVIAHLFSVLPKAHLNEEQVPEDLLREMAETAKQYEVKIEIDERWKCPSFRTVSYFKSQNVPILFSTDSHRKETIGKYKYNLGVFEQLRSTI